jgi:hypothetical protein
VTPGPRILDPSGTHFRDLGSIFPLTSHLKNFRYERLANEHSILTEQRLRASSVYDALAQVLLTELIFTIALCYGIYSMRGQQAGQLAAVCLKFT